MRQIILPEDHSRGATYLYNGSATGRSKCSDWFATGDQAGYKFGFSVYTAGDVNGDGYSDVVVGKPDSGKVFVYHGSASGMSTSPDWQASGASNSGFGYSVSTAGDVDGDGYSEILVGASRQYRTGVCLFRIAGQDFPRIVSGRLAVTVQQILWDSMSGPPEM